MESYERALQISLLYGIIAYLFCVNNAASACTWAMAICSSYWFLKAIVRLWRES